MEEEIQMNPILLYPVGTDKIGRPLYSGVQFPGLHALKLFQMANKFHGAIIISGGAVYGARDVDQAIADFNQEKAS